MYKEMSAIDGSQCLVRMENIAKASLRWLVIYALFNFGISKSIKNGDVRVLWEPTTNGVKLEVRTGEKQHFSGFLAVGDDITRINRLFEPESRTINITIVESGFKITRETELDDELMDCIKFQKNLHWYGGPQRKEQYWPIEKMKINGSEPYVLKQLDNFAVAERYWLNSLGGYVYITESTPLFVEQNETGVCFISRAKNPYIGRTKNVFEYYMILKNNPKEAHLHAINSYLGKPTGHPHEKMIAEPIWTTWAKYKKEINDLVVLKFAEDIRKHGYENGQIEIDDEWEKCYGAQEFTTRKFRDVANTVKKLKEMKFRVTLWVHPFIDNNCQNNSDFGISKGYFVANTEGDTKATWWNSNDSHQIDFTNPEATEWYSARLRKLQQNPGIDSFKFDAGETNYAPQPGVYKHVTAESVPNTLSAHYVRNCAKFGSLVEVRSAWRTQDLPIFVRMIDKDTNWGIENGLLTLITTLLQMNINGYTMVLPDMIGGNGYAGQLPDAELLVRWTQANTFMPAMQFSYLPWEFSSPNFDAPKIIQNFVKLHEDHAKDIIEAMQNSIKFGTPVNGPIWWIDPMDKKALACYDEYLLGEKILVAPVYTKGATSRDVYLPKGQWTDGTNGNKYSGPRLIKDYPAPIDVLPWFTKSE